LIILLIGGNVICLIHLVQPYHQKTPDRNSTIVLKSQIGEDIYMKIYRTGDDGTAALFSGERVSKTHLRVETRHGGRTQLRDQVARTLKPDPQTGAGWARPEPAFLHLGADIATPLDARSDRAARVDAEMLRWLEDHRRHERLRRSRTSCCRAGRLRRRSHVARTVCRRAGGWPWPARARALGEHILKYLNRLSDFLFLRGCWKTYRPVWRREVGVR
jgi:cob(I)alamin adenosyltransferase